MTTITVTHDDNEVEEIFFEPEIKTITLGRRTSNDVCIPDLSVSGNHAKITLQDNQVIIEDLNSTNGTYVNGQITQRTAIHVGDEIILGKILLGFASAASVDGAALVADSTLENQPSADNIISDTPAAATASPYEVADDEGKALEDAALDVPANDVVAEVNNISAVAASEDQGSTSSRKAAASDQAHPLDGVEHLVVPNDKPTVTPMHELDSPSNTSKGAVIEIKNGAKSGQILPIDKPVTTLGRPGIQIAAIMRKPDGYFLMHIESDDNVDKPTLNKDSIGDEPVMLHSGDALTVAGIEVEFMLS